MDFFPNLEPVCCSTCCSICCFLTCIQISQETGQVVWYSHLFKNFPQFVVIHTVKGFGIVNKAEVNAFLNSLAFSMIQWMLLIWSLVPLPFLKPAWTSGSSRFTYCCFLTCIQISQEAAQMVCYAHLLKNFPQFVVIHTVKGFGIVNKA